MAGPTRVTGLTAATGSVTGDVMLVDNVGFTDAKKITPEVFFTAWIGANYARTVNVDAALSGTLQALEVGGAATPIQVSTTKVLVGIDGGNVGFLGADPIPLQLIDGSSTSPAIDTVTVPGTYTATTQNILQRIVNMMALLGLGNTNGV